MSKTKESFCIFLDDERWPDEVKWVDIGNHQWYISRSYFDAVSLIEELGFPDVVSFDHDLGIDLDGKELTGYDFAKYLCQLDMDKGGMPEDFKFTVHSQNPVGARNIKNYLDMYILKK